MTKTATRSSNELFDSIDCNDPRVKQLRSYYTRLNISQTAERVWRMLSTDERAQFGSLQEAWDQHRTVRMYAIARGVSIDLAVIQLTRKFGYLPESDYYELMDLIGEQIPPAEPRRPEAQRRAIEDGKLVLIRPEKVAYWLGQRIPEEPHTLTDLDWTVLDWLVRRAETRSPVNFSDVYPDALEPTRSVSKVCDDSDDSPSDESSPPGALRSAIYRLKKKLPEQLTKQIKAEDDYSYRLHLDSEQIAVFG